LGISDRHHFEWLTSALGRFEAQQGKLAALAHKSGPHAIWCKAGQQEIPPVVSLRDSLGSAHREVVCFDKFPTGPGVHPIDLHALEGLPDAACDVRALFRASYFINDPPRFLAQVLRALRSGGLAVIDWLHDVSDAPVLGVQGDEGYGGAPRITTYCHPQIPHEFTDEFGRFPRHVNRPPAWADVEKPGTPVSCRERGRRVIGGGPRGRVAVEGYGVMSRRFERPSSARASI
jgi:SAM-dependent methyltransferase